MEKNYLSRTGMSDMAAPDCWETADLDEHLKPGKLDMNVLEEGLAMLGMSSGMFGVQRRTDIAEDSEVFGNGKTSSSWESASAGKAGGGKPLQQDLEQVDAFLREALQNPRDRLTILRMEQEVEKFLRNPELQTLEFQPMISSYYRLAAHRVAQHYYLQTQASDTPGGEGGRIIARKTGDNRSPALRLADIPFPLADSNTVAEVPGADKGGTVKVAIKQRPSNHGNRGLSSNASGSQANPPKTMEERKEEYNKARARIFSSDSLNTLAGNSEEDVPITRGNLTEGVEGSGNSHEKDEGSSHSRDIPVAISAGNGEVDRKQTSAWRSGVLGENEGEMNNGGRGSGESKQFTGGKTTSAVVEEIGGKGRAARVAILRDREKERRDPDFDRNYDRYSQRFDQGFGAVTMPPYGIQAMYAPLVTYNSEFPSLSGPVATGPPRIRPSPPPLNMYSESSQAPVVTSMSSPWGQTLHPLGGQYCNGDPMIGGTWVNPGMGMATHGGVPLLFPPMGTPGQQQHVSYQPLQMGSSGVSYVTAEQYQASVVQSDIHFTQQSASRRR